ncbi:MAG: cytochrome C [Pseudomonadota bacterium]
MGRLSIILLLLAVVAVGVGGYVLMPRTQAQTETAAVPKAFAGCVACHVIRAPDGVVLAGARGRTGPNLYGVFGAPAASVAGFRYRSGLVRAGEKGLVWTQEALTAYLQNPTAFLRDFLGDADVRSAMSYREPDPVQAAELATYLAQFAFAP